MIHQKILKTGPPNLYKVSIVLMLIFWIVPMKPSIEFPLNLIGLPIFFSGVFMAFHAKNLFRKSETPISPNATPTKLHRKGLFKYTRNPMYLGIVIGLTGIALLTGRTINLVFPILYIYIMNRVFIKIEEHNLEKEFGKQFLDYKSKVRRWI